MNYLCNWLQVSRNGYYDWRMRPSVNRPGHIESFFHRLKTKLIRGRVFKSEQKLRYALNSYINQLYNHQRLHSAIGYLPPAVFEQRAA